MLARKTVKRFIFLAILFILINTVGCRIQIVFQEDLEEGVEQKPLKQDDDLEVKNDIDFDNGKDLLNVNYERKKKVYKSSSSIELEEFEKIFLPILDLEYFYEGAGDKGYRQRIVAIREDDSKTVIKGVGQTRNMFEGNPIFNFRYDIEQEGVRFIVTNRHMYHPDIITDLVVLRGPLEVGTTWEQYVNFPNFREKVVMKAVITDVSKLESGEKKYVVRYAVNMREIFDENYYLEEFYKEERHFVQGKGLVFYANTQEDGTLRGYKLNNVGMFGM